MKKLLSFTIIMILLTTNSFIVNANTDINILLNGTAVVFDETTGYPYVDENNRTMVPLRATMESAGFVVGYDATAQTAIVITENNRIEVPIGTNKIYVDNVLKENDTNAVIKDGRTYLPIRIIFESINYEVEWIARANLIRVYYADYDQSSKVENIQVHYWNEDLNKAIYPQSSRYDTTELKIEFHNEEKEDDIDGIILNDSEE